MDMDHLTNNIAYIDIREFTEKPGPFCISYGFDLNNIIASIESVGLINKPYIRRTSANSIDIVTGYRRILALKALKWDRVPCIELMDVCLSDKDLLLLNIYDNLCTRRFNYVEKGMILNRLLMYYQREVIYRSYINLLDISGRREVDILIKIEELDDDAKEIIAGGSLSIKTIESLFELKDHSQNVVLKWIIKLKLNINQQMLFIEYINDISIREEKSIQEILNEANFAGLIMEDGINNPQKAKRFIELLRARRMPVLTRNEKAFARQISNLGLPKSVRIKHAPFFENPDYLLEISFRDGNKLKEIIDALAGIKGFSNIKDPWKE
jgi:ParB family transcriptional regulator, chromosome partitioning protein